MFQQYEFAEPWVDTAAIVDAQGTAAKAMGSDTRRVVRVDALFLTNDDSIVHNIEVAVYNGVASATLGSIAVPIGAGHAGAATVEVIGTLLPATAPYILVPIGGYISIRAEVAMNTGKVVNGSALGGVF